LPHVVQRRTYVTVNRDLLATKHYYVQVSVPAVGLIMRRLSPPANTA